MNLFQKISFRLPLMVILAAGIAAVSVGAFSYIEASKEIHREATNELLAIRDARHIALKQYLGSIEEDLEILATNEQTINALTQFRNAFGQIDVTRRFESEDDLRRVFTPETPAGNRNALKGGLSDPILEYFYAHNSYHSWFSDVTRLRGYYDLFLISPVGDVIYSMFKEADFASNISVGKWSDTGLARVFERSMNATGKDLIVFEGFKAYEPSENAPAAFIGRKIVHQGRTIGAIVLQMPIGRIRDVMQMTAGMGETGESYLVGSDNLMRSDSRFSETSTILAAVVNTDTVAGALKGESGVREIRGYRGGQVLSAYRPLNFRGANWALLAEKGIAEIRRPINEMLRSTIYIVFALVFVVGFGGLLLSRSITRPLANLSQSVVNFHQTQQVPDSSLFPKNDEIGDIARGFHAAANDVSKLIDEIKLGESDLQEREARLRTLLQVSPIGFLLVRHSGETLMVNEALLRLLNLDEDTFDQFNAREFYQNSNDRDAYLKALELKGEINGFEVALKNADGKPFWATLSAKVIDYQGSKAILTWLDDITERKNNERTMSDQRQALKSVLENTVQAIVAVDKNLDLVVCNRRFQELLSLPDELVVPGTSTRAMVEHAADVGFYGDGDHEELVESRMAALSSGKSLSVEIETNDGLIWYATLQSAEDGSFVMTYTDITERKNAETNLADAYHVISSSIDYASRIQRSILPETDDISSAFKDHFIIWEPRDVVGGDIYWAGHWGDGFLLILGDCTGHGVPGAFMTLISMGAIDRAMGEVKVGHVGDLLTRMHQFIQITLSQHYEGGESDDGIELGAVFFKMDQPDMIFSGARFDLFISDGVELSTIKGTKAGAGYRGIPHDQDYAENTISLSPGQKFYMTSDGLIDQIGGVKRRAFGKRRLKELLETVYELPFEDQKNRLIDSLRQHQGNENRRDDVSVIGFQLNG